MKIEDNVAVLTPHEVDVHMLTEMIEDVEGLPKSEAARHALSVLPDPDPAFVQWVSLGLLALVNGIVETLPYGRP